MLSENRIREIIHEEITKNDEKKIKAIVADCVKDLFKSLWQKDNFWKNDIKR